MDLSNLRTSLDGLDESTSRRRAVHLDSTEHELNAHFRSSALQLTTLYRQAVNSSKASYEKGYAHALAHVLELWDTDRDWLRGYIQRRMEAVEVGDDDGEERELPREVDLDEDEDQRQRSARAGPSSTPRRPTRLTTQSPAPTPKSAKRTRSTSSTPLLDAARKSRRAPTPAPLPTALPFSSSFDFSVPTSLAMTPLTAAPDSAAEAKRKQGRDMPVIKISTPASQRRRLRKLSGLRAGADRVLEIDHPHPALRFNSSSNDMQDDDDEHVVSEADAAWTDDEEDDAPTHDPPRKTTWMDRSAPASHDKLTPPPPALDHDHQRVLERMDRRKRRRAHEP